MIIHTYYKKEGRLMHIATNLDAKTIGALIAVIFGVIILIKGMNTPPGGSNGKGSGGSSNNNNTPPSPPPSAE